MRSLPDSFHPLLRAWFEREYGQPTRVQSETWERVARGEHVLAVAPTGSGKTLAAFLDALSGFATGRLDPRRLSVLYVSPLKALNEDIRENLTRPLRSLATLFAARGEAFPDVTVATRSGDTPQAERRRMVTRPPSILATTPESLSLLLNAPKSREVLSGVRLVIVDEAHALLESKRGSFLSLALERLALLAGEFQRVSLSATVEPPSLAASFVAGFAPGPGGPAPRTVAVVVPAAEKRLELSVRWPRVEADDEERSRFAAIAGRTKEHLERSDTVLVFTETRRTAERVARLVNDACGEGAACAHHGSLSKETRRSVETRLKEGRLRCVVATASLELGIDIGSVGEVLLVGTPPTASRALQRIGRSGHAVGKPSRATVYPLHELDLLRAAALSDALLPPGSGGVVAPALDAARCPDNPLDVLSQSLVAMCACDRWKPDDLYDFVRRAWPFRGLPRELFDSVVASLRERGSGAEAGKARPKLVYDAGRDELAASDGMLALVYSSGGAIPDRGTFELRVRGSRARIGELDEEFVWERRVGDSFVFGTRSWRIVEIADDAVEVEPLARATEFMPFWKADPGSVGGTLALRERGLLDAFARSESPDAFASFLERDRHFEAEAAAALARFLGRQAAVQRDAEGKKIPVGAGASIAVEIASDTAHPAGASRTGDAARHHDAVSVIVHAFRGRAVLEPFAIALGESFERVLDLPVRVSCDDRAVLFELPASASVEDTLKAALADLAKPGRFESAVRGGLPRSGAFGAAFRENAERALLLPKGGFRKRRPLWITRLRAKRLFARLSANPDHPVVVETFRTCLNDVFDLDGARSFVDDLASGAAILRFFRSSAPTGFARGVLWRQTNVKLYEGDGLGDAARASATDRAIALAGADARARIRVGRETFDEALRRIRREEPGWAPTGDAELAEWVRERIAIDRPSFDRLRACPGGEAAAGGDLPPGLVALRLPGAAVDLVAHRESLDALEADPAELLGSWLPREGATDGRAIAALFGWGRDRIDAALAELEEAGRVARGAFVDGDDDVSDRVCDADAYAYMLRRGRIAARPSVLVRPPSIIAPLFARLHGIRGASDPSASDGARRVEASLRALEGWGAPARLWETELLPVRVPEYRPSDLDAAISGRTWLWYGAGKETIAFCRAEQAAAFFRDAESGPLADFDEALDFWEIRDRLGIDLSDCERALWRAVWSGSVSSDSFESIRRGLREGFSPPRARAAADAREPEPGFGGGRPLPRALDSARREARRVYPRRPDGRDPMPGRWYGLELDLSGLDDVDEAELAAERARAALARYGIVCRATLAREEGRCSWSEVYPALRRLELSGEAVTGYFVEGLGGPQFALPGIDELLAKADEVRGVYALCAADPASVCGLGLPDPQEVLPQRSATARLVYRGAEPLVVSRSSGRELRFFAPPSDPDLREAARRLADPVRRAVDPASRVVVETIAGARAADSPYAAALEAAGFEPDRGTMTLWR